MIADRIKTFKRVKVTDLIDNPKNWRKHPDAQRNALGGLLESVGWADAVLARETDEGLMLIDGHLRKELAADSKVPVLVLDVTEAEADLILATHDPLTAMAETDQALLDELVQGLDIDNDETQKMLDELASDPVLEVVEDEVPELPEEPTTKTGDLFELGDHRLLCGDATSAEDVARLVSGGKIDLAFCSPPYNVGGNTMGGHLKNSKVHSKYTDIDDNMPVDEYSQFLSTTMSHMLAHCTYAVIDIQMLAANKIVLIEWLHEYRDHICDVAIWNKTFGAPAMGDNVLNSAFEFLWIFASEKKPSRRIKTAAFRCNVQNVYTAGKQTSNEFSGVHAATFPVHLPTWVISTITKHGDVMDLFCGTGTTLIAAEQLGRKCYGMEISPAYCDVIIQRWENLTGNKARKV